MRNDYVNSVFLYMLSFKAKPLGRTVDDYPRYVSTELDIYNPIKKHQELINNGFLRRATVAEILDTMQVASLKAILANFNLPAKGKKADLISFICTEIPEEQLNLPMLYCVSDKGRDFLSQHEDFVKLHGNPYNISYDEYIAAKAEVNPACSYNDVLWYIFDKRALNGVYSKRNIALYRAIFLSTENKLSDSLYNYIVVLFYDVHDPTFDNIAPGIKNKLYELKKYYTDEMLDRCYTRIDVKNKMPKHEFKTILEKTFRKK